jgi:hypothetical protein
VPAARRGAAQPEPGAVPGATAAAVLFAIYALTLAPDVTFWDAGEFIAAAHALGIPHPPGTPLYVVVAHVWSRAVGPALGPAVAVNLLSAVCTAAAGGLTAALFARWSGGRLLGVAAALCAGTMSTVWLNATETEVYAPALLLSCLLLWAGDRAGRTADPRWSLVLAYLFALAVPLHLSALVAAPAAILLAASPRAGRVRAQDAALLALALLLAAAIGTVSTPVLALAFLAVPVAATVSWRGGRLQAAAVAGLALLGASVVAVMLVRARLDPSINQGNPATLDALLAVVGRRQYAVAAVLPRQAPFWLQLGNLLEYADWQVALSLAPGVEPSWWRTPLTVAYAALAVAGGVAHRRLDTRSWRAMLLLLVGASVGVVAYLNLKAGPSYGHGVLPDGTEREARERDYFFALAFWGWGAWAGLGAAWLAARAAPARAWLGVALAALPALLNWRAVNRRAQPDAALPRALAAAILRSAPEGALLFLAGDNDSYPLWYLQQAEGVRPDVALVTIPLLGAPWYRAELARRYALVGDRGVREWRGAGPLLSEIATRAEVLGHPVAASVAVEARERAAIGACWRQRGMVYVLEEPATDGEDARAPRACGTVDSAATAAVARDLAPLLATPARAGTDPTAAYVHELLACPSLGLEPGQSGLLDSRCNRR